MTEDRRPESGVAIDVDILLEDGIALARQGKRQEAQMVFRRIIQLTPEHEDGWLWMAWLAETREQSLDYLREGLHFVPDSERIREGISWVETHKQSGASVSVDNEDQPLTDDVAPPKAARETAPKTQPKRQGTQKRQAAQKMSRLPRTKPVIRWPKLKRLPAKLPGVPSVNMGRLTGSLRGLGVTMLSLAGMALIGLLIALVIRQAGVREPTVSAMVLPTRVLDATPTPSVEQLSRPLWTKVEIAWTQEDWDSAISALENIRSQDPQNAEARERLSEALYNKARRAIESNELESAKRDLDYAIRLDADNSHLQSTRRDVELYRDAVEAFLQQEWGRAVYLLTQVYERTPDFRDTQTMLGQAHCNLAELQLTNDNLDEALAQAKLCEEILEGDPEGQAMVQSVQDTIRPPRRIEVSLSRYRTTVYEDHEPIRQFPVCVGRPSHPTKTGRFAVQTKMDMAYGSAWDLYMPNWIGIYWAGGTENGFHELPILSSGATLWQGALGTGCSFGCIVLGPEDSEWLYNWTEMGTVVIIER